MFNKVLCFVLAIYMLSGCASLPDDKSVEARAAQSSQSKTSSQTMMQRAKLKQSKAVSEKLALYGPTFFEKSKKAYQEAEALYKDQGNQQNIKRQAATSIEYVNAGLRNKKIVKDTLQVSLANYDVLSQLNASQIDPDGYQATINKFLDLVRLVEQRKIDEAKNNERDVAKYMRLFEVKIIGKKYLEQCLSMLTEAETQGAKTLLPDTYKETQDTLKDTRQFIRQNPRQATKIQQLSEQCEFNAQRLLSLTREGLKFKNTTEQQMERYLLIQEERLSRIAKVLGHNDIRNLSFDDQSRTLSNEAEKSVDLLEAAENDNANLSPAQFEKWKRKTVLLQSEVRRLQKIIKRLESN